MYSCVSNVLEFVEFALSYKQKIVWSDVQTILFQHLYKLLLLLAVLGLQAKLEFRVDFTEEIPSDIGPFNAFRELCREHLKAKPLL